MFFARSIAEVLYSLSEYSNSNFYRWRIELRAFKRSDIKIGFDDI